MSRNRKKRNKKYRPADGATTDTPVIHRYVAEQEQSKDSRKKWKRRGILYAIASFLLLLVLWLVF